jgi:hypothetical protein
VPTTHPPDLHLDVGVVRAGRGVPRSVVLDLEPLVAQLSEAVGRVVDLTVLRTYDDGDRQEVELRCWLAGLATVSASGSGPTVALAAAAARRQLLRRVAALSPHVA